MPLLHVINGSAMLPTLQEAQIEGDIIEFADVLHEGPVPPDDDVSKWIRVRAEFIAACGWARPHQVYDQLSGAHAAMTAFREYDDVILWYEHDLFDQLLLLRHLAWWWRHAPLDPPSLVSPADYLGAMTAAELHAQFAARQRVTEAQLTLAAAAWDAFTAPEPHELVRIIEHENTSALPHLPGALIRLLEEYPSRHNGLGRTEQQILEILAQSPLTREDLFAANARREERVFMGDAVFYLRLRRLYGAARPLIARRIDDAPVALTDHGRRVLEGSEDAIVLNGIDRWIGGVHLTGENVWRREDHTLVHG